MNRSSTAFLFIPVGGVGHATFSKMFEFEEFAERRVPFSTVYIDTDVIDDRRIDFPCQLKLSKEIIKTLYGNPNRFSPVIPKLQSALATKLEADQLVNGARTTRPITQLGFIYYRSLIAYQIRRAITKLNQEHNPQTILPILFSSSGGGSGSALQILLASEMVKPRFRRRILFGGRNSILERAISFVAEPFCLAEDAAADHASLILANAMAFRMESESLLQKGVYQMIFHECYSNELGTVIHNHDAMCRLLAISIVEFTRNWNFFKARLVDPSIVAVNRRTNFENTFSGSHS